MAATLPGCPIVGFYDEVKGDFAGHQRSIELGDGKWKERDLTKAYGYVDSTAKIWFQKFIDDGVEHTYLMTEGYLWTSIYEEAKKVIEHGSNQSMELNEEHLNGSWATDENGWPTFFIINEAMIQKLCILGEDVEPCFEGAGIAAQFSLDESFKNKLFSEIENMKNALSKGGLNPMDEENKVLTDEDTEFKKKPEDEEEDKKEESPAEDAPAADDEDKPAEEEASEDEDDDEKKKKAKHSLEDVTTSDEYISLLNDYNALNTEYATLKSEVDSLRAFKAEKDKEAKQAMIDSFYMLSDADKADVITNIDSYSVDDIEAKLSIICVRNKVNFNLDNDNQDNKPEHKEEPMVYTLDSDNDDGDSVPAWIKAVRETAKNL